MTSGATADVLAEVVAATRFRLGLAEGDAEDVRPFYEERLEGFWVVPLFAGDRGRVAVVMSEGGAVAAHAGLDRAAARLRHLGVLQRDPAWTAENLRPLLDAVGGLTPGCPRYPREQGSVDGDGSVRLLLTVPEPWVRYAARGGRGPQPPEELSDDPRGATPPAPTGTMEVTLDRRYDLSWRYSVGGEELGSFAGRPEDDTPDELPPLAAEERIAAARKRLRSPLAVPAAPAAADRVTFLGLGEA